MILLVLTLVSKLEAFYKQTGQCFVKRLKEKAFYLLYLHSILAVVMSYLYVLFSRPITLLTTELVW